MTHAPRFSGAAGRAALVAAGLALSAGHAGAQDAPTAAQSANSSAAASATPRVDPVHFDLGLQARPLGSGVYVVEGANADFSIGNGCNIINTGFVVTGAGVLVINTGVSRRQGEQLRALIARTTAEPVVQVLHLNLHPDYFLGNQAFADVPRRATAATRAGMAREAAAYETNLYRLCGDWMSGTEALLPDARTEPGLDTLLDPATRSGMLRIGEREFVLQEFSGHTDSDLVLIDRRSRVAFVGGLAFVDRVPTTPHARVADWLGSLERLQALMAIEGVHTLVPSHGPVRASLDGIHQTRAYLQWLDHQFGLWAHQGWEMTEVLQAPVPRPYRDWAAFKTEYVRNVVHLYPRYERQVLVTPAPR